MFSAFRISLARIISADSAISATSESADELTGLFLAAAGAEKAESAVPVTVSEAARSVTTAFLRKLTGNTSSFSILYLSIANGSGRFKQGVLQLTQDESEA